MFLFLPKVVTEACRCPSRTLRRPLITRRTSPTVATAIHFPPLSIPRWTIEAMVPTVAAVQHPISIITTIRSRSATCRCYRLCARWILHCVSICTFLKVKFQFYLRICITKQSNSIKNPNIGFYLGNFPTCLHFVNSLFSI